VGVFENGRLVMALSVILFCGIALVGCATTAQVTALEEKTQQALEAETPKQQKVEKATLQVVVDFSNTGEVALKVKKLDPASYEPEEMARLLSHWFCKILYLLPYPEPRIFLLKEVDQCLFEPKLKPKDNVLRKAQIDDVVKLVNKLGREKITSSISLYLKKFPDEKRGLISHLSRNGTEQQTVFSWAVILQYATLNYSSKDLNFIYDMMQETTKAYSGGADPDILENTVIIPNDSFFRAKVNLARQGISDDKKAQFLNERIKYVDKQASKLWRETFGLEEVFNIIRSRHALGVITASVVATPDLINSDSDIDEDYIIDLATSYINNSNFSDYAKLQLVTEGLKKLVYDSFTAAKHHDAAKLSELYQTFLLLPIGGPIGIPEDKKKEIINITEKIFSYATFMSLIYKVRFCEEVNSSEQQPTKNRKILSCRKNFSNTRIILNVTKKLFIFNNFTYPLA